MPEKKAPSRSNGMGIDASGGPVVDPTKNVLDLSEASNQRQDDLREAHEKLVQAELRHIKELAEVRDKNQSDLAHVREKHQMELRRAESERLDSIRQVDREDVNKTAAQALSAIQTLAATTNTTAETLRTQVATTAQSTANVLTTITGEINKRLSALELAGSEGKGKSALSDPMMEKMIARVETLLSTGDKSTGKTAGINWTAALIVGGISLFATLLGIAGVLYAVLKP
jgi:hypothetical protein